MTRLFSPCVRGLDTSSTAQGAVDCVRLAAAGIRFIVLRASIGTGIDRWFSRNRQAAHAAGLIVFIYGVVVPGPPIPQAAALVSVVGALQENEVVFVDFESKGDRADDAEAWCCHVDAALGRRTGVYSYAPFLRASGLQAGHGLAARDLWLAAYVGSVPSVPMPFPRNALRIWQCWGDEGVEAVAREFGETGIPGANIDGTGVHVDRSVFDGNEAAMLAWIASTSLAQLPPPPYQPPPDASHALELEALADTDPAPAPPVQE